MVRFGIRRFKLVVKMAKWAKAASILTASLTSGTKNKALAAIADALLTNQDAIVDANEKDLAQAVQDGALCALGSSAPNPVLTTIQYFKDEYIAHVREHRCPAGVCKDLITYAIDPALCTGCTSCARQCPNNCIRGEKKKPHVIDTNLCIRCGICKETCKFDAVKVS